MRLLVYFSQERSEKLKQKSPFALCIIAVRDKQS